MYRTFEQGVNACEKLLVKDFSLRTRISEIEGESSWFTNTCSIFLPESFEKDKRIERYTGQASENIQSAWAIAMDSICAKCTADDSVCAAGAKLFNLHDDYHHQVSDANRGVKYYHKDVEVVDIIHPGEKENDALASAYDDFISAVKLTVKRQHKDNVDLSSRAYDCLCNNNLHKAAMPILTGNCIAVQSLEHCTIMF